MDEKGILTYFATRLLEIAGFCERKSSPAVVCSGFWAYGLQELTGSNPKPEFESNLELKA